MTEWFTTADADFFHLLASSGAYVQYLEANYDAAEESLKSSLATTERSYGPSHLCTAQSMADLAVFYCKIKKYSEVGLFSEAFGPHTLRFIL